MYLSSRAIRFIIEALEQTSQHWLDQAEQSHITDDQISDLTNDALFLKAVLSDLIPIAEQSANGIYAVPLEYNPSGLPYVEGIPDASLQAKVIDNEFTISGNRKGLLFLAHQLIGLAYMEGKTEHKDYHIHLDDLYKLNNNRINFILRLDEG